MNADPAILWLGRTLLGAQAVILLVAACKVYQETFPPMDWSELPQRWTELRLRHVLPVAGFGAAALVLLAFGMALLPK